MDTFDLASYLKALKGLLGTYMIKKKIIISLIFLSFLNGCAQNAVFLGPAITGASTGSIYQAGLSYGTGTVIKKITGKTTTENVKNILYVKKKAQKKESYEEFFDTTKSQIDKKSEIKDLASQ